MEKIIKLVLSYLLNLFQIIKIKKIGKNVYVRSGLQVLSGKWITLEDNVRIGKCCRLSCYSIGENIGKILIKRDCYIGDYFSILAGSDITIGSNTLIASFVTITSENHGMDPECGIRYGNQPLIGNPITIGKNCWIGEKVIILPGINIGDWSIVGSGAIVTKDVPSFSIVVGNPARIIKRYNFKTHTWEKV